MYIEELFTFSIRRYAEKQTGIRKLGLWRYAVNILYVGFIFEFWSLRKSKDDL